MKLVAGFYVDRAGRARVSLAGRNSIGFKDHEEARVVYRRIEKHAPSTVEELRAVTGLNPKCLAKLLRPAED
jgi:hypothetical protein